MGTLATGSGNIRHVRELAALGILPFMTFHLAAYLERIGLTVTPKTTLEGLTAVHGGQLVNVPFENLDVLMGRGVDADIPAVFDKLVTRRRGGYCFECNGLLCAALTALGFNARLLLGRVLIGAPDFVPGLTHAVVLIELDGRRFIADAGFGGLTPRAPFALRDGAEIEHRALRWRLRRDDEFGWRLHALQDDEWKTMYVFGEATVYPTDIVLGNHWTSTSPLSSFTKWPSLARHLPSGGRITVNGARLIDRSGDTEHVRMLADATDVLAAVRDDLGIPLNPDSHELETLWRPRPD